MSTFQKAPQSVIDMALGLMTQFESHKLLCDAKVKIDFLFAFGDVDPDTGERKAHAIMERGIRILGKAKAITLKDRAKGMGDAEIILDGDHWNEIGDAERAALLDHEIQHLTPKVDERGFVRDDLGRCKIKIRKHDCEFGFFAIIAERHGAASQERIQSARIMDVYGQFFFPGFAPAKV